MAIAMQVTRANIDKVMEKTGRTRQDLEMDLARCEEEGTVCVVMLSPTDAQPQLVFPRRKGSW